MKTMKIAFFTLILLFSSLNADNTVNYRQKKLSSNIYEFKYTVANWKHPDYSKPFFSYGNHRILIEIKDDSKPVKAVIPWRRRDLKPEEKELIIISEKTREVIKNKIVVKSDNYSGTILFIPNKKSFKYFIYYLPHKSSGGYYPKLHYIKAKKHSLKEWLNKSNLKIKAFTDAKIIEAQSIDEFNSFFPMEIISNKKEVEAFINKFPKDFYLFPEYRNRSIKMKRFLPLHWVKTENYINGLKDTVKKGEYYTFQIGVFSDSKDLKILKVDLENLQNKDYPKITKSFTCFNIEGTDLNGKEFKKEISVNKNRVQALWCGLQIPKDIKPGIYKGKVLVHTVENGMQTAYITLKITDEIIVNHGDNQPENMTRLRWLNSKIGSERSFIIKPFSSVKIKNKNIKILGREIELNSTGLPKNILSYFSEDVTKIGKKSKNILANSIRLAIISNKGNKEKWSSENYRIKQEYKSEADWEVLNNSENFILKTKGHIEYDGMLSYKLILTAKRDFSVDDIRLEIPFKSESAKYMLGLGEKGGKLKNISWKWDVEKNQEGVWIGAVSRGLQFVLRDENYERPLNTNFYHSKPLKMPKSWCNKNRGGILIKQLKDTVIVKNYSGKRKLKKGDTLHFNIRFLITPFKTIDFKEHFNTRFVHKYIPVEEAAKLRGTVINIHHANEINPYINYPFYNSKKQRDYIEKAHKIGIKVKLYNTIRELTYKAYEFFALRSLDFEIFNDGEGGGHSWLQEHLISNYHSAWHANSVNDASILDKGNSRWTNYYIEGINWLAKNQKIDGLYLDDIAFSRTTVKRISSVLSKTRKNFVIDLHSANQYNNRDGFNNSAFLYMEHFPFITRLWFGEYFEYGLNPDYWLIEVSGIPFGLTGEMLEKGGRPYRGMIYGMTTRVYGKYNPTAIWKLFDDFGIADSKMFGYWIKKSPINGNCNSIKITSYLKKNKALIVFASWSNSDKRIKLKIDWKKLGFEKKNALLYSPRIKGLQEKKVYELDKDILIKANYGLILILKSKDI